jgi:fatty-acyl-CoA synthase
MLTHFGLLNNALFIGKRLNISKQDNICVPVPLYHCFGMVLGNLCALNYGAGIVMPSDVFNAQQTL